MSVNSAVAMLMFADLGMSNGLINLVAEATGTDDCDGLRSAIASAFWMLFVIGLAIIIGALAFYRVIPWASLFNVHSPKALEECGPVFLVLIFCFAIGLPLAVVASLQTGQQNGLILNIWSASGSVLSMGLVLLAIHFHAGLPMLVLGLSGGPLLVGFINAGRTFLYDQPGLKPRPVFFSRAVALRLLRTGSMFFCLQLATSIGYQSDNLVIAHIMGAASVPGYAVPSRLFNVLPVLIGIVTGPMWPAYADAISRGDGRWIGKTFRRVVTWTGGTTLIFAVFLVASSRAILSNWVGPGLHVSLFLMTMFGFRCILSSYLQPLSCFLNGVGKLKEQAFLALLMAFVNICLSILLVQRFGVVGAILGTVISELLIVLVPESLIAAGALRRLSRLYSITSKEDPKVATDQRRPAYSGGNRR